MKAMLEALQVSANSAFSARNPYPGWIASAPVISAAAIRLGIRRYEARLGGGPMQTSSSANRTWSDSRSASEYTATVSRPSSRQARMTRSAISPRLAMSTFLNMGGARVEAGRDRGAMSHVTPVAPYPRPRVCVTLSEAKGPCVRVGPLHCVQGDSASVPCHYGVRSSAREADASPVSSVNLRSDAESTPETRSANSLGLVE